MKIFKKIVYANSEYRISRYKLFGITIIKKVKENKQQNQSTKKIFFLRLPVLQVIKNEVGIKVKLFGIQVFKNKKNNNIVKYYVLGIKIFSKKLFISHISIDDILEFKQFEKPLVSIIIPVYNQYNYTIQCLQSILKSKDTTPFEIIIADDCSTDKTRTITKKVKNISVITSNKNLGYIKNCNNAAKHARGKYLYFLNNDTIVQHKWLEPLVSTFSLKNNVGVVGSKILNSDGSIQECGVLMYKDIFHNKLSNDSNNSRNNYLKKCDYVSGCSLITPKNLFNKIGGFDEKFSPAYCDDPDYCLAARNLGFDTYVQPKSKILHFGNISYSNTSNSLMNRNNILLREKWGSFFNSRINFAEYKETSDLTRNPTILIIDDLLPQFDKHAGGKTIFQYCQLLEKMGLNVKFCQFFNDNLEEPYYSLLSDMGIEIISRYEVKNWIEKNTKLLDYILLSRPQIAECFMIKSIKARGIKVLYYGHDLHHLRMQREKKFNPNFSDKEIEKMKTLEETIISLSDEAFYPSFVEKDYIQKNFGLNNVDVMIPYLYDVNKMPKHEPFNKSSGIIFVGSSHGPNLDGLKWFINEVLPLINKKLPDLTLYVVGSSQNDEVKAMESDNIKTLGFLSQEQLDELYSRVRLSIAPLRYGAGVKGKIIDSLYHGVPVITTSIGAEAILAPKEIVNIADTPQSFADALVTKYKTLSNDQINRLCKNFIKENYSFEKGEKILKRYIDLSPRNNYGDKK